mgnify:FL=1
MDICKICLEEITDYEDVYAPCNCRGNMNYIHIKCFIRAYVLTHKSQCEICKMNFPIWNSNTYYVFPNNNIEDNINFNRPLNRNFNNFIEHYHYETKKLLFKIFYFILTFIYYFIIAFICIKIILIVSNIFESVYNMEFSNVI